MLDLRFDGHVEKKQCRRADDGSGSALKERFRRRREQRRSIRGACLIELFFEPAEQRRQIATPKRPLRQSICPERLLGRMNASMRFIAWGTMPIGALLGGALGSTIGLRPALLISATGSSLAFLWVYFSPLRGLREVR